MLKGIAFALGACLLWGLTFVVPEFEQSFSPIEVALGRYFVFGFLSVVLFYASWRKGLCRHSFEIWKTALLFAFASNIGCYTLLVLGLRYSNAEISALIVGVAPITIAFYGNWRNRECSFSTLLLPSILILLGLVCINGVPFTGGEMSWGYTLGILCSCGTLVAWSWFVVANAAFVKEHPEVSASDWTTLMGVGTLICVLGLTLVIALFFPHDIDFSRYLVFDEALLRFVIGCVILGLVCSGVAAFLWNRASYYLPVALAGQLTVFQVVFGLIFAYMVDRRLPSAAEITGILLFLGAIAYGIKGLIPANKPKPREV